jgi:hypothetical protein
MVRDTRTLFGVAVVENTNSGNNSKGMMAKKIN